MKTIDLFEAKKKTQTLYVSRKLLNGEDIVAWAHSQGFETCLDPKEMHATIAYSKDKIDVSQMTDSFDTIRVPAGKHRGKREMKLFGEKKDCVVLSFECEELHVRWKEIIDDFGASWDHDGYHPHITISYTGMPEGMSLDDIEPYKGKLEFGPEIHQEVNIKWKGKVKEKKTKAKIDESVGEGAAPKKLEASPENIERAKEFVLKKWRERAAERFYPEPEDLSSSCKFTSMFAQAVFGGQIQGNYEHQYLVLNGEIIDLNIDAADVKDMEDPHEHDDSWFGNDEHVESMESCKPRVRDWVREFMSGLNESFTLDSLHGSEVDRLVAIFKDSYEAQTGSSWAEDKLISRASNWTFYGDEDGYIAVRSQASGMKKMVAVAGDPKSVLKGMKELQDEGGPIWGAVSGQLAAMAKKRGMIVPHLIPGGVVLIKALASTIPASVFGGVKPTVTDNGGIVLEYDDTGSATKYFVGNKEYFQTALKLPMMAAKVNQIPGLKQIIGVMNINESVEHPAHLYHGTSTGQLMKLKEAEYVAKNLYLGEDVENICEQYALLAAAKDGTNPMIIEIDPSKLTGDLQPDHHDGSDEPEAGQYIYNGPFRNAVVRFHTWDEDGEQNIPVMENENFNWPTVQFEELWHVGSMNPADKRTGSYEGAGLSVSRHPMSWQQIARGQVSGEIWKLTKEGNRFLNFHRLNEHQKRVIIEWGINHGMVKQETTYHVSYYDDEMEETRSLECDTMEEATEEAEFMGLDTDAITVDKGSLKATPKLVLLSKNAPGGFEALVPVYVEAMLPLDGVWWQDNFDPSKLSAPRGVICVDKISSWKAVIDHSADDADDGDFD